MKISPIILLVLLCLSSISQAQTLSKSIPYVEAGHERQVLDIYAPENAKDLPVVFWIHGGGWQTGDKSSVQKKPQFFTEQGFVFVSTNYRLLPEVDMGTIIRDVAKAVRWTHENIAQYGGDPQRLFVMGHSAGAQLAAILCTDACYLTAEKVPFASLKGCVPVDGDTYDVPLIIKTAADRRKSLGQPDPKFGHYEKFGNDPKLHFDFSAVNHVASDKGIPPFFILHVASHADTTAQAQRLGKVLTDAKVTAIVFGAKDTNHTDINANLGVANDPATMALTEFLSDLK